MSYLNLIHLIIYTNFCLALFLIMIGQCIQASYDARKKFMIISEMIMSISENIITPQSLGLSIYLMYIDQKSWLFLLVIMVYVTNMIHLEDIKQVLQYIHLIHLTLILWTAIPSGQYIPIF